MEGAAAWSEDPEVSTRDLAAFVRDRTVASAEDPAVAAFVEHFRSRYGDALAAVVFYGSRLSETTKTPNSIYDFFLFTDDYGRFYEDRRDAFLNRFLAPNTYHAKVGAESCKYNVVSLADFRRETSPRARDLFHAGRFSKRVALVWCRDAAVEAELLQRFVEAMRLVLSLAVSRLGASFTEDELLHAVMAISYAAEVRVEADTKVAKLLEAQRAFYQAVYGELLRRYAAERPDVRFDAARGLWTQDGALAARARERTERLLARSRRRMFVRWFKYMGTLEGWLDMLLDKIERTKGIRLELTPLQRKYPYVFGWPLVYRFMREGLAK